MNDKEGLPNDQLDWINSFLNQKEADGFFTSKLSEDVQSILH